MSKFPRVEDRGWQPGNGSGIWSRSISLLVFSGEVWYSLASLAPGVRIRSEDEILTIRAVAALLKIEEKTTYTMAQNSQLPGVKVCGQRRLRRSYIERWISARLDEVRRPATASGTDDGNARTK